MSYQVGVDLGTTYTAAAVHRDGVTTIFTLGSRTAAVPSVVLLRADGTVLTGDAAERRANSEPERVVREFKRRFGDTTPIIVGGSPYSAEALTARLLQAVLGEINNREGGPASRIVITHPANWGHYKRELLDQTVRLAGLNPDLVGFITEPEAAALSYAAQERVEPGEVVAVYDLGGGTFDAAVLRRTASGFAIVGKPEGIERLGGIDFDAAVFAHLTGSLGAALSALDPDDPAALMAVTRLRQDCVESKEALSSDTDAAVAVVLPTVHTEVRITRQEFEGLIRPALLDTIEALRRAIRSAGLTVDDVSRVLLVGGSSRIPLISQLVSSELRRPVAVDAHPKHTVALGAALAASGHWVAESVVEVGPSRAPNPGPAGHLDPSATVVAPAPPAKASVAAEPTPVAAAPPKALPVRSSQLLGPPPSGALIAPPPAVVPPITAPPVDGAPSHRNDPAYQPTTIYQEADPQRTAYLPSASGLPGPGLPSPTSGSAGRSSLRPASSIGLGSSYPGRRSFGPPGSVGPQPQPVLPAPVSRSGLGRTLMLVLIAVAVALVVAVIFVLATR